MKVILPIFPKIGCHGNVSRGIEKNQLLIKLSQLLITLVPNSPAPSEFSWTKSGKILYASRTTSYILNSGVTEPKLSKILRNVEALVALLSHAYCRH